MAPPGVPTTEKVKQEPVHEKVMMIMSYDHEDIILSHQVPPGVTVNSSYLSHLYGQHCDANDRISCCLVQFCFATTPDVVLPMRYRLSYDHGVTRYWSIHHISRISVTAILTCSPKCKNNFGDSVSVIFPALFVP